MSRSVGPLDLDRDAEWINVEGAAEASWPTEAAPPNDIPDSGPWDEFDPADGPWFLPDGSPVMDPVVPFDPQTPAHVGSACTPFSRVPPTAFVPVSNLNQPVAQILDATAKAMAGSWIGVATAQPGWLPPRWYVTITFGTHGHYLAMGYDTSPPSLNTPAFYYGSNDDTDSSCVGQKQWSLASVGADGSVAGPINIPFWYGTYCNHARMAGRALRDRARQLQRPARVHRSCRPGLACEASCGMKFSSSPPPPRPRLRWAPAPANRDLRARRASR